MKKKMKKHKDLDKEKEKPITTPTSESYLQTFCSKTPDLSSLITVLVGVCIQGKEGGKKKRHLKSRLQHALPHRPWRGSAGGR